MTVGVGSMTCARIFAAIAIAGLPTSLKPNNIGLLFWSSSDFRQLTLLPVIIAGQNIQAMAGDARAAQTFEDAEQAKADFQQAKADLITALETPQEACHLGQAAVPSGRTRKHSTADNTYARLEGRRSECWVGGRGEGGGGKWAKAATRHRAQLLELRVVKWDIQRLVVAATHNR